jgi:hypothetical protein
MMMRQPRRVRPIIAGQLIAAVVDSKGSLASPVTRVPARPVIGSRTILVIPPCVIRASRMIIGIGTPNGRGKTRSVICSRCGYPPVG